MTCSKEIVLSQPRVRYFDMPTPLHVQRVDCFKLFDVIFQSNFKFNHHVNSLLRQCSQTISIFKVLPKSPFCEIFRTPHQDFAISFRNAKEFYHYKNSIFEHKIDQNSACIGICSRFLHQTGGSPDRPGSRYHSNLPLTDSCCHGNENLAFCPENWLYTWYLGLCGSEVSGSCTKMGVGQFHGVIQNCPGQTPVATV